MTEQENINNMLIDALSKGKTRKIKECVEKGGDGKIMNCFGQTPLMYIARNGYLEATLQLLKDENLDIDVYDGGKWTALMYAIKNRHFKVVEALLKHGAEPNVSSKYGITSVCCAVLWGNIKILKILLEYGADVNKGSENKYMTPLMYASVCGKYKTVKLLLEYGADVNKELLCGTTAKSCAEEKGYENIVELLESYM